MTQQVLLSDICFSYIFKIHILLYLECRYDAIVKKIDSKIEALKQKFTPLVVAQEMVKDNLDGRVGKCPKYMVDFPLYQPVKDYLNEKFPWVKPKFSRSITIFGMRQGDACFGAIFHGVVSISYHCIKQKVMLKEQPSNYQDINC